MTKIFKVDNNNICITRGDSGSVELAITDKNQTPYRLEDGDSLLLTVKKGCDYTESLIVKDEYKTVERQKDGLKIYLYIFSFSPNDTADLQFGNYVYDIKLNYANGDVNTIVDTSLFRVCKAVGS